MESEQNQNQIRFLQSVELQQNYKRIRAESEQNLNRIRPKSEQNQSKIRTENKIKS